MIKTAGKVAFLFLLLFPLVLVGELSLSVIDEYGDSLEQAQVGRPFMVEVTLKNGNQTDKAPDVEGIDQFVLQNAMRQYEMVNGVTTIKHTYAVVARRPGEYTVGPATIADNNQKEVSNVVMIKVGREELHTGGNAIQAPTLLRLFLDKKDVVKGEKVVATLRFYYTDPSEKLSHFIEQPVEGVNRRKARTPRQGTEKVNDIEYNYIELEWDMYPQKSGTITIPAFGAEYEVRIKRDHMWGGLGRLFGTLSEPKRIYSNAVALQVNDLPKTDMPIQGVGRIDSFHIAAYPASVAQGEGTVVTLSIQGSFDPDSFTFPGLQGMPKELRFFDSEITVDEPSRAHDPFVKHFEYVVQGMETGNWEIPAQAMHYYDVASYSYKTLKTAPLYITVMRGQAKQSISLPSQEDQREEIFFALEKKGIHLSPHKVLPWWFFFLLTVLPLCIWVFQHGMQSVHHQRKKSYRTRRAHNAFTLAFKQLQKLKMSESPERLYTLFIELFADKWQLPLIGITAEYINQRLQDVGMPEKQLKKWDTFFTAIAEQAFGAHRTKQEVQNLFKQAEEWLKILQHLL